MSTTAAKQYTLPFQEDYTMEAEAAAVFALAEFERGKGSGLIVKHQEERLLFLSKVGYPLWLFPKKDQTFIFDGLNYSNFVVVYNEIPSSKLFKKKLESSSQLLEDYFTFLSNYADYFRKPLPDTQFTLKGLIVDPDFKNDFKVYFKEAFEAVDKTAQNFFSIEPNLNLKDMENLLSEFDSLQTSLKEEADNLPECLKLIKKTNILFKIAIEYESAAAKEEADAKIKAIEEYVNPKIVKIKKEYNQNIKNVTRSFDKEIQRLQKLQARTTRSINKNQKKIRNYGWEAEAQEKMRHLIYEKRWREKIKRTESEMNGLKKELKTIGNNIESLCKEKGQKIHKLKFDLESEIKQVQQPIIDLEKERDDKTIFFRQQILKMIALGTPVINGINRNLKCWESIQDKFVDIGIKEKFDLPSLFYIPFYFACFLENETKRYLIVPPSTVGHLDFSTKLKGAIGISRIKDLLNPRFKAIAAFLQNLQELIQENVQFENHLFRLGEKNNLLKSGVFQTNIEEGLSFMKKAGWISDKEYKALSKQI